MHDGLMTRPAPAGVWLLTVPLLLTGVLATVTSVLLIALIGVNVFVGGEGLAGIIFGPVVLGAAGWAVVCGLACWALARRERRALTAARLLAAVQVPGGLLVAALLSADARNSDGTFAVGVAVLHVLLALVLLSATALPSVRAWYESASARNA